MMRAMMRARKEKGQILILVLVVMVFGVIVVTPLLAYVDISLRLFTRTHDRAAAYYAADAGVERVISDMYQRINILDPGYYVIPDGSIKGYTFNATADLPEGEAPPPPETEVYLDPGGCFGMRPIGVGANSSYNYTIILPQGQSLKVNWAAYVLDIDNWEEHCRGEIELWLNDTLITSSLYSGDQEDGDEGRAVAITLDIPGWNITEAGTYSIKFKNYSYLNDPGNPVPVYAKCFASQGDDDHTFTGSITSNPSNFMAYNSTVGKYEITILAFNEAGSDTGNPINTNTIFGDYVEVTITTADGNASTYNFASGSHKTWTGEIDVANPLNINDRMGGTGYSASPLTNTSAIEAFDGVRHMVVDPGDDDNACLWHEFYIDEDPNDVTRIDVRWEGYQARTVEGKADDDELYLLLWSYVESGGDNKYHILDNRQQDAGYTWVKVYQGAAVDYIIISTAYDEDAPDTPIVTITAYVRQLPGPTAWWEEQRLEILTWKIDWH
jgi:hypothetical protein